MPCGVGREGLAWRGKAGWVPTRAGLVDGAGAGLVDGGGRARALIPGEGVRKGPELAWWTGGQGGGARARGGARASVPGG